MYLSIESSITLKRKDPPINSSSSVQASNKRCKSVGFVSMREHAKLTTQLAQVTEENLTLQTTWMRMYFHNSFIRTKQCMLIDILYFVLSS